MIPNNAEVDGEKRANHGRGTVRELRARRAVEAIVTPAAPPHASTDESVAPSRPDEPGVPFPHLAEDAYDAELEALLLTHPEIDDAAVVAATDAEGEEIPKAFVVRHDGSALDEEGVMAFVAEHVAPYKKVRAVAFLDAVPKSSSGKILRKDLKGR